VKRRRSTAQRRGGWYLVLAQHVAVSLLVGVALCVGGYVGLVLSFEHGGPWGMAGAVASGCAMVAGASRVLGASRALGVRL
jgi:hypothetical protein